jgi:hypothetical protein
MFNRRTRNSACVIAAAALLGAGAVSLTPTARSSSGSRVTESGTRTAEAPAGSAFSWLVPAAPTKTWSTATIASGGATLFYPSNWRRSRATAGR